jgi:ComF family protein
MGTASADQECDYVHMLGIIAPDSCALCGLRDSCKGLCEGCRDDLPWIGAACERCGEPLSSGQLCGACQLRPPPFIRACAPLAYAYPVDNALKALKFRRKLFYAPAFGRLLLSFFAEFFDNRDALLPVPLHRRRHILRGFNQATEICRPLQRKTGLPVIGNVRRRKFTKPQTGLDAAQRRRNLSNAFEVRGGLRCRHPLVVDDVITTGQTCGQLAEALLGAGAESVGVLAVARASSV